MGKGSINSIENTAFLHWLFAGFRITPVLVEQGMHSTHTWSGLFIVLTSIALSTRTCSHTLFLFGGNYRFLYLIFQTRLIHIVFFHPSLCVFVVAKMSWGSLLQRSAADEATQMRALHDTVIRKAADASAKTVVKGNSHQPFIDAVHEARRARDVVLQKLSDDRIEVQNTALRCAVGILLLEAQLLCQSCETAEAYKLLEIIKTALEKQRSLQHISKTDLEIPHARKVATPPSFHNITYPSTEVDLSNTDLLARCITEMGLQWSTWGECGNAQHCFEEVLFLVTHCNAVIGEAKLPVRQTPFKLSSFVIANRDTILNGVVPVEGSDETIFSKYGTLGESGLSLRSEVDSVIAAARETERRFAMVQKKEQQQQAAALKRKLALRKQRRSGGAPVTTPLQSIPAEAAKEMASLFASACLALAQLEKHKGNTTLSCFFCHVSLQRDLSSRYPPDSLSSAIDCATNCLNLAAVYCEVGDLSHVHHCLEAAECTAEEILSGAGEEGEGLRELHRFTSAAYLQKCVSVCCTAMTGGGAAAPSGTLCSVLARVVRRAKVMCTDTPASANSLLAEIGLESGNATKVSVPLCHISEDNSDIACIAALRLPLHTLPISPPQRTAVLSEAAFYTTTANAVCVLQNLMYDEKLSIENDCEKHCLVRLWMCEVLEAFAGFLRGTRSCHVDVHDVDLPRGCTANVSLLLVDIAKERIRVADELFALGLDELVFRNVLRQAHYISASAHQDLVETLAPAQALPQEGLDALRKTSSEHFEKFSARFLKEFKETQKVITDPKEKTAFLKLEGYVRFKLPYHHTRLCTIMIQGDKQSSFYTWVSL